jgi:hypothetical protein
MTKHEKWELAGVGVAILVILYFMLRKNNVVVVPGASDSTDYGPWYLAYNVPKGYFPSVNGSAYGNTNPNVPSCGCSDEALFGSTRQFTDYLTSKFSDIADSYTANVMSVLPPFLKQVVNNTTAVSEAARANAVVFG